MYCSVLLRICSQFPTRTINKIVRHKSPRKKTRRNLFCDSRKQHQYILYKEIITIIVNIRMIKLKAIYSQRKRMSSSQSEHKNDK